MKMRLAGGLSGAPATKVVRGGLEDLARIAEAIGKTFSEANGACAEWVPALVVCFASAPTRTYRRPTAVLCSVVALLQFHLS